MESTESTKNDHQTCDQAQRLPCLEREQTVRKRLRDPQAIQEMGVVTSLDYLQRVLDLLVCPLSPNLDHGPAIEELALVFYLLDSRIFNLGHDHVRTDNSLETFLS